MLIARIGGRTSEVIGETISNGVKKYLTVDLGMVDVWEVEEETPVAAPKPIKAKTVKAVKKPKKVIEVKAPKVKAKRGK